MVLHSQVFLKYILNRNDCFYIHVYMYEFTVMFVFSEAQLNLQKFWFKGSSSVYNVEGIAFLNLVQSPYFALNILCLIVNNSINNKNLFGTFLRTIL